VVPDLVYGDVLGDPHAGAREHRVAARGDQGRILHAAGARRGVDRGIDHRHDRPRVGHEHRAELLDRTYRRFEVTAREVALLGAVVDADLDGATVAVATRRSAVVELGLARHDV